jgi:hypothetical protein
MSQGQPSRMRRLPRLPLNEPPTRNGPMPEIIPTATLAERLFAAFQHALAKKALSRGIYSIARAEWPALKRLLIRSFLGRHRVNLSEAAKSDLPEGSTGAMCEGVLERLSSREPDRALKLVFREIANSRPGPPSFPHSPAGQRT